MDHNIPELIQKFFDGKCSSEEKLILNEWYYSFDKEQDPAEILDEKERIVYEQLMLERINANISRIERYSEPSYTKKSASLKTLVYVLSGIAAMFLVVFGLNFVRNRNIVQNDQSIVSEKIVFTNTGKSIKKVILSDGSNVWLSPNSSIEALNNFQKDKREVFLNGLAFFEVTKNKKRPFIIKTNTITTKVWGTSFTVNAYKNTSIAKVSVLTGKVSVSMPNNDKTKFHQNLMNSEIMLLPNQNVTYSATNHRLFKVSGQSSDLKIWKKIKMSYYNTKMNEVIKDLNQKFGVHITPDDDKINNYLFIADLSEQDLPSILEILKTSLNLRYEIDNDTITLRSNN